MVNTRWWGVASAVRRSVVPRRLNSAMTMADKAVDACRTCTRHRRAAANASAVSSAPASDFGRMRPTDRLRVAAAIERGRDIGIVRIEANEAIDRRHGREQ